MDTQSGGSYMLRRIATRAGVGVWRHKGGVLVAGLVAVALVGYVAYSDVGTLALPAALGGSAMAVGAGNNDCADTAMAAVADKSPTAAQRAYQCMDTTFQQRVPEAQFVQQMQTQKMPNIDKLARVGDYHTAAGGTMVYYAIDGGGQSVGYIVYLGQDGKVLKIE
jgi:hypothetical protein